MLNVNTTPIILNYTHLIYLIRILTIYYISDSRLNSHLGLNCGIQSASGFSMANSFSKSSLQSNCPSRTTNWSPFCNWCPHATHTKHLRWKTEPSALITSSLAEIDCKHPWHLAPKNLHKTRKICVDERYIKYLSTEIPLVTYRQKISSLNLLILRLFIQDSDAQKLGDMLLLNFLENITPGCAQLRRWLLSRVKYTHKHNTVRRRHQLACRLLKVIPVLNMKRLA